MKRLEQQIQFEEQQRLLEQKRREDLLKQFEEEKKKQEIEKKKHVSKNFGGKVEKGGKMTSIDIHIDFFGEK